MQAVFPQAIVHRLCFNPNRSLSALGINVIGASAVFHRRHLVSAQEVNQGFSQYSGSINTGDIVRVNRNFRRLDYSLNFITKNPCHHGSVSRQNGLKLYMTGMVNVGGHIFVNLGEVFVNLFNTKL